jgi:4'-phosphopantetheinyl transferase
VAHCGELGAVAVTDVGDVGVDIEHLREDVDVDRVASRVFPAEESRRLALLPDTARARAFFEHWVRTEALVKAMGSRLLSSRVSEAGLATSFPVASQPGPRRPSWSLCGFSPAPDVTGCVAVRARGPARVRLRSLAELEVTRSA